MNTTDNMTRRGPRCLICGEFVSFTVRDPNGKDVCMDCGGERINAGIIVPESGGDRGSR